jgi:glucan 1,3-beta-glucosidase
VLEPWVTPSLFYQFEGKPPQQTAMDHYTFCSILGPREGNRQLREHWRKWVTEDDLRALVDQGINTLRIPVGDWMWQPYPPYTGFARASPE